MICTIRVYARNEKDFVSLSLFLSSIPSLRPLQGFAPAHQPFDFDRLVGVWLGVAFRSASGFGQFSFRRYLGRDRFLVRLLRHHVPHVRVCGENTAADDSASRHRPAGQMSQRGLNSRWRPRIPSRAFLDGKTLHECRIFDCLVSPDSVISHFLF